VTGGGGFWVFGAAVALPKGFDFGDSVCALKLHTLQTATRIRTNDFIVEKMYARICLIRVRPPKRSSVEAALATTAFLQGRVGKPLDYNCSIL